MNPSPETPKSPAEQLRDKRHRLAAESGHDYFPSDMRYDGAIDSLERALSSNPGRGILDIMDGLARLYEYQFVLGNEPHYRDATVVAEVAQHVESAQKALLTSTEKLTPTDRQLALVTTALTTANEYLRRFHHEEGEQGKNLGLSRNYVRSAIERILGAFATPSP